MKVFRVAHTTTIPHGISAYLEHIGAKDWMTDAPDCSSELVEIGGRLCYKSFGVGLNPNITKVREGNYDYIGNILKQKHGSVLEHASVSFILCDVSRILTHELVRHRPGMAYSQESQRFVRLDNFEVFIPDLTDSLEALFEHQFPDQTKEQRDNWVFSMQQQFMDITEEVSSITRSHLTEFISDAGLDEDAVPFHIKKQITSALRRFVPGSVNTSIMVTGNHRAWRHLIANRTNGGVEIEIVECFNLIASQLLGYYGNLYQDMKQEDHPDYRKLYKYSFANEKV